MHRMCLQPALLAAAIASAWSAPASAAAASGAGASASHSAGSPLPSLVLIGSAASVRATPGMLAYGVAKAATHHIVRSVGDPASALCKGGGAAYGLLPHTIDTPSNRRYMKYDDTWTPIPHLADAIIQLVTTAVSGKAALSGQEVASGALIEARTAGGKTAWHVLDA